MPKKVNLNTIVSALEIRKIEMAGEYRGMNQRTVFRCPKGHTWSATMGNVYHKKKGCPHCSGNARLTKEKINARLGKDGNTLRLIGNYRNNASETDFQCLLCGNRRPLVPACVLAGHGCAYCAGNARLTQAELNGRLAVRGISTMFEPKNARTPCVFECPNGHSWSATPDNVLRGTGCPTCATPGFDPNISALLYYVRYATVDHGEVFKIGVTNRTVRDRFSAKEWPYVTVLAQRYFETGRQAKAVEQAIKRKFAKYQWRGEKILRCGGNTELFVVDVLALHEGRNNPFLGCVVPADRYNTDLNCGRS